MKAIVAVFLAAMVTACGQRKVEVGTAPQQASEVSLNVTNNASQAVNVYVTSGGNDIFVGQVAANSTQRLAVAGVASGSSVSLKARLVDGTRTYSKDNVSLTNTYAWTVP